MFSIVQNIWLRFATGSRRAARLTAGRRRRRTSFASIQHLEPRTLLSTFAAPADFAEFDETPTAAAITIRSFGYSLARDAASGIWSFSTPSAVPELAESGDSEAPGKWIPGSEIVTDGVGFLNLSGSGGQTRDNNSVVPLGGGGTKVAADNDSEAARVREMLSSLRSIPSDEALSERPANNAADREAPHLRSAPATEQGTVPTPGEVEASEGGMMEIARDAAIEYVAAAPSPTELELESLLSVPVKMDSTYGKFQAFEVSTGEDPRHQSSSPPAETDDLPLPQVETPPTAVLETAVEETPPAESASAANEAPIDEKVALALAPRAREEETSDSSTYAAAVVFFVAFAVRETYAARAWGPNEESEERARLPRR